MRLVALCAPLRLIAIKCLLLTLLAAMLNVMAAMPSRAQTTQATGTKGWCTFINPGSGQSACYASAVEACERQQSEIGGPGQLYAPATTYRWNMQNCMWQYVTNYSLPGLVSFECETGFQLEAPGHCDRFRQPNRTCASSRGGAHTPITRHPINIVTGSKSFRANDFQSADGTLSFDRNFVSRPFGGTDNAVVRFGSSLANWFAPFDISIQLGYDWDYQSKIAVLNPDGTSQVHIKQSDGTLKARTDFGEPSGTDSTLQYVGTTPSNWGAVVNATSTWLLTDAQNNVWTLQTTQDPGASTYRVARPTSVQRPDGTVLLFTYTGATLTTITDQAGKAITLEWNQVPTGATTTASSTIKKLNLPGGYTVEYTYQSNAGTTSTGMSVTRLSKVEYKDNLGVLKDSTSYQYGDSRNPTFVTAILDSAGAVRWKVTYDEYGRATRSEGPNGELGDVIAYTDGNPYFSRTQTNALGKQTVYSYMKGTYDAWAKPTGIQGVATASCAASSTVDTYDSNSFINSSTDEEGRVTKYTRNTLGQATQTIEGFGTAQARTIDTTWHPIFDLPTQIVEAGLTTNYTYDAQGRLTVLSQVDTTTQTVPYSTNGQTRTWTYTYGTTGGGKGKLLTVNGPLSGTGDTTTYTYNANGYLASVTNEVGKSTTVTAWDWRGAPLTVVDPNAVSTTFTYDIHGRALTATINPGGSQSQYVFAYDVVGNLTKVTLPKGGYLEYTYDTASRLTKIKNEQNQTINLTVNNAGQTTLSVTKNASATATAQQSMVYDELGRLIQTLGAASTTPTQMAYDKVSNPTQTTDGRGKLWKTGFDALNRVIEATNPDNQKTKYGYAANDALTSHKDGRDLETTRITNGFGDVIREVSPDSGTKTYWYDLAGRLTKVIDADGVESNYAYDNAGRLLSKTFPGASWETVTYTYDSTASSNKGNGRLTSVTDQSGSTAYTYDAQGRVTKDAKVINGISYNVQYAYDTNGEVTQITLPSGRVVSLTRNNSGYTTAITTKPTSSGTVSNVATSITYQPFGDLKSLTYGNSLTLTNTFDLNEWLGRIQVKDGSTAKFDLTYLYYDDGRLGEIDDNAATGRTVYMALNDTGRLNWAGGPWGQEGYNYDAAGNRIGSYLTIGGVTTDNNEITANDSNHLVEVQGTYGNTKRQLGYRLGGDLYQDTAGGTTYTYLYSSRKRLVVVQKNGVDAAYYGHDFLEQRVWRRLFNGASTTEIHYIFDQAGHLLAEHNGTTGAVLREYIWLDEKPLAVVESTGSSKVTYYIHSGHLNEPQMMTNAAKAKVWDAYVTPFGSAQVFATGTASVDIRLPGQWFQAEAAGSGLNQNHYRDYDPSLGRYIEVDPLGIAGGPNPYAYVNGMPYDLIDPDGLQIVAPLPRMGPFASPGMNTSSLADALNDVWQQRSIKIYVTYTRYNPITGIFYSGRTSGYIKANSPFPDCDAQFFVNRRSAQQRHLTAEGFNYGVLDRYSPEYFPIRGREQMLIDYHGGARSQGGYSRNMINGINADHIFGQTMINQAIAKFGPLPNNAPKK